MAETDLELDPGDLDHATLASLKVGDLIEVPSPFPALSEEPIILQTDKITGQKIEFLVTQFGITLGRWVVNNEPLGMSWQL